MSNAVDIWETEIMIDQQRDVLIYNGLWVMIGACFISIILWFVAIVINTTEREQFKHDTCMVITDSYVTNNAPATRVTEYCGAKHE